MLNRFFERRTASATASPFALIKTLRPQLAQHPWVTSGLVVLGVVETLSEGIGISLFIPFFYSLNVESWQPESDNDLLTGILDSILAWLPAAPENMTFIKRKSRQR